MTEEEQKQAMEAPPKGTFAMMMIYALVFTAAWALFHYGILIPRGPVN